MSVFTLSSFSQMVGCRTRGFSFTRALLGISADELHLCGDAAAVPLIQEILKVTDDVVKAWHFSFTLNELFSFSSEKLCHDSFNFISEKLIHLFGLKCAPPPLFAYACVFVYAWTKLWRRTIVTGGESE